jgi:hypothetical protein
MIADAQEKPSTNRCSGEVVGGFTALSAAAEIRRLSRTAAAANRPGTAKLAFLDRFRYNETAFDLAVLCI